ncbi:MAG: ATP-binding cassette domain-containing protein [Deltaproteobacteria bacterium]|nr:MAG: ATP-binding cassette domain-containing protein [Deltaproteobacteria bacterium]
MGISVLRVENLIKRYESGFALDIPHLEFQSGRIYGLVGPNGAGKTTLLNLLNLLEEPTEGEMFFEERRFTDLDPLDIRRKMTMVMENPFLFHTTVFKNITAGLKCRSVDKKMWPAMSKEALRTVGLKGFENRYAPALSRGETQRVAIARALVLKPEVLFLDEPFTNIRQRDIDLFEKLTKTINQEYQTTIIFTTHDLPQAHRLSDEVISLVDGRIIEGSIENLFEGTVEEIDGTQSVKISPKISVSVITEKRGKVNISIAPREIILSHGAIISSARNSFKGIIRKIQMEGQTVIVNISVDEEVEFTALITETSFKNMGLPIDSEIYLTFKSTSVTIF